MAVEWLSKCKCDFCSKDINDVLYDAKTINGCWATMCHKCYSQFGLGKLGIGYGQKYVNKDGKFICQKGA